MVSTTARKQVFAKRVGRLREERELTQADLGRQVGVSGTCVWNWEGANTYPRPVTMRRLAKALGTTVEFLSGDEGFAPNSQRHSGHQQPLAEIILEARRSVSAAAGIPLEKVRVVLDWGD